MNPFPILALLFIAIPLLEIYLLIKVGSAIGALPTVLLVILTAIAGAALLRQQGLATMSRFQATVDRGELPASEMLEGVALLISGVLLLTPGFFTDALGLLGLLPPTRLALVRAILSKMTIVSGEQGAKPADTPRQGKIIEGEFTRED